jgi:hypothetical protein
MKDLGYETHNSVLLLGSLGIFAMWYWSRVLFYVFILIPLAIFSKRFLKYAYVLKRKLFFGDLITITIEGYFEYIIAAYLNLSIPLKKGSGEILGNVLAFYSAILCLFLFPMIWVVLLFTSQKKLNSKKFKEKYG